MAKSETTIANAGATALRRVMHDFNEDADWAIDLDGPQDFEVGQRIVMFCCCMEVEAVITGVRPLRNSVSGRQYLTVQADWSTWSAHEDNHA